MVSEQNGRVLGRREEVETRKGYISFLNFRFFFQHAVFNNFGCGDFKWQ